MKKHRIIVAITGAAGSVYGVRLLEELREHDEIETHLIVSRAGFLNVATELRMPRTALEELADVVHDNRDIGATIASGSFRTNGMLVAPCTMKTLAAISIGLADNLVSRAADVVLKERRRLVLMVRETPLNLAHLKNMTAVTEMGGIIFPPVPSFYAKLENLDAMVDQTVGRMLDLFDIESNLVRRWPGVKERAANPDITNYTPRDLACYFGRDEKYIRRYLRAAGHGVGSGNRYNFTADEWEQVVKDLDERGLKKTSPATARGE